MAKVSDISSYLLVLRDRARTLSVLRSPSFAKERQSAQIIRMVHSIEKGLCLENPRLGFGVAKLTKLFSECRLHAEEFGKDQFCLKMARGVIKTYIDFHTERHFTSPDFDRIRQEFAELAGVTEQNDASFGGTICIEGSSNLSFDQLSEFFRSRHSIRDFDRGEIPQEDILKAIEAAQYAPSACNRQAVRAYVLSSAKICEFYANDLAGIGGFASEADKFILITGKLSSYDTSEHNQYIVSASIFATYLVEALHAMGIGSCMIQRPLYFSKQWQRIAQRIGAPQDERLVLMIALGRLKDAYKVPCSRRLPTGEVVTFVD